MNIGTELHAIGNGQILWINAEDNWAPENDSVETRSGIYIVYVVKDENGRLVLVHESHLSEVDNLSPGNQVLAGQSIGKSGNSGNARTRGEDGKQVHIGIQLVEELPEKIRNNVYRAIEGRLQPEDLIDDSYQADDPYCIYKSPFAYRVPVIHSPGGNNYDPGHFLEDLLKNAQPAPRLCDVFR